MGKKGKKALAGRPSKKIINKLLDALVTNIEEELRSADHFAPLPSTEDCNICLVPMPRDMIKARHMPCCGKGICYACGIENERVVIKQNEIKAAKNQEAIEHMCPFCREPGPFEDEHIQQLKTMASLGNHWAYFELAVEYSGGHSIAKDKVKSLECLIRAAELGSADACVSIASHCKKGLVIAADDDKCILFYRAAALRGDLIAHHKIGCLEYDSENYELGIRHWKFAAEHGNQLSVNSLRNIYNATEKMPGKEFISKECMDKVYRASFAAQEEVYSEAREKYLNN